MRSPRATKIRTRAGSKLPELRLAEVLGSLSLATDLATGVPPESALRTCLVATHLSRILDLPAQVRRDTYYASLLRQLGCTAWAHEAAALAGGDDHDLLRTFEAVDSSRKTAVIGLGRGKSATRRARSIAAVLAAPRARDRLAFAQCAQAEQLALDLGLGAGVATALAQMSEHHDGSGAPHGLRGEEITLAARVLVAAQLIEALHRRFGRERALDGIRRRHGRMCHPALAGLAAAAAGTLWAILEARARDHMLAAEPTPWLEIESAQLDAVALTFARFADLKLPSSLGHSPATAALAVSAGRMAGCTRGELELLHRAALLHDLGSVSVPNGVWGTADRSMRRRGSRSGCTRITPSASCPAPRCSPRSPRSPARITNGSTAAAITAAPARTASRDSLACSRQPMRLRRCAPTARIARHAPRPTRRASSSARCARAGCARMRSPPCARLAPSVASFPRYRPG
ncbi:MAG: HD domain-containing phosphohydrolase [Kofleriaceae bacterium]